MIKNKLKLTWRIAYLGTFHPAVPTLKVLAGRGRLPVWAENPAHNWVNEAEFSD